MSNIPEGQLQNSLFMCLIEKCIKYLRFLLWKTLKLVIPLIQITQPGSCSLAVKMRGRFLKATPQREGIVSRHFSVCEGEKNMSLTC